MSWWTVWTDYGHQTVSGGWSGRMLGRRPAVHDPRTLKLSTYLRSYQAPPPARDWTHSAAPEWGTMLNEVIGDCTIAAPCHGIQAWTANHGREVTVSDDVIRQVYSQISGYVPGNPATDGGCVWLDVMKFWRTSGIGGHKIEAFVAVDPHDRLEVQAAISLFGGVFLGVNLPLAAQEQTVWDVPFHLTHADAPGSWGGHAIYVPAYSRVGATCVTWGTLKQFTWEWSGAYTDEAYAVLAPEWVSADVAAPNGLDINQLRADLAAITK